MSKISIGRKDEGNGGALTIVQINKEEKVIRHCSSQEYAPRRIKLLGQRELKDKENTILNGFKI